MRCGIALYEIRQPDSIGTYDELVHLAELPGDEEPEVWAECLYDWGLAKLRAHDCRFGIYFATVVPLDDEGLPDEEQIGARLEQDFVPIERRFVWSGDEELVPA